MEVLYYGIVTHGIYGGEDANGAEKPSEEAKYFPLLRFKLDKTDV